MRNRAFRRHQTETHMWRRLKEDRNQHYTDLTCACWTDPRAMARMKEQPKLCSCWMCANVRHNQKSINDRLTRQEKRMLEADRLSLSWF